MSKRLPESLDNLTHRTKKYRANRRAEGSARIDLWIPPEVEHKCQQLMRARELGRKELIVALIIEAAEKLPDVPANQEKEG